MAHYALIDSNGIVVNVIVGKDEDDLSDGVTSWEDFYGEFHGLECKRTSYNTYAGTHSEGGVPFRGNYAGIGYTYDENLDAFIPPKPFDSWTLNESCYCWEAPVAPPTDDKIYSWNEETQSWDSANPKD